jgi:hypothetical protein
MGLAFSTPSRGKVVLVIAVLALLILALATAYWYMSRPQYPWLFKGAYAVYKGIRHEFFFFQNVTLGLKVVDFNRTHAKILLYAEITEPAGLASTRTDRMWEVIYVDLTRRSYSSEKFRLERVYEEKMHIEGLGVRKLKVYVFERMVMYVDSETLWPVKVTYRGPFDFRVDLNMVETNIPGLKRE